MREEATREEGSDGTPQVFGKGGEMCFLAGIAVVLVELVLRGSDGEDNVPCGVAMTDTEVGQLAGAVRTRLQTSMFDHVDVRRLFSSRALVPLFSSRGPMG